jgi:integrase
MRKGIYKSSRDNWYISAKVTICGKRRTLTFRGYPSKSAASADYDRAIAEWKRKHSGIFQAVFFRDLVTAYEDDRELKGIALQTRRGPDLTAFSHMKCWNNKLIKDALSDDSVKKWYRSIVTGFSINSANKTITRFKDLLRFANKNSFISTDVMDRLQSITEMLKYERKPRKEKIAWSMEEEKSFLNSIPKDSRDYPMLTLACYLGCRIGEFVALKFEDYDRETKKIKFSHQIIEATGTGTYIDTPFLKTKTSYREKPLTKDVYLLLEDFIDNTGKRKGDYLWTGIDGIKPISKHSFRMTMRKYCFISGIRDNTPHGLRHTMSTWLGSQCHTVTDVVAAAKMTGNTPTVFLDTYANHIKSEDEDKLVSGVSEAFSKSHTRVGRS